MIQKEIWQQVIIEHLFKDNAFLNYAFNADQYVLNGAVVHIPQAGAPSNVERNRQTLPASVKQRQDIDVTYALDEFTTDPKLIPNAEKYELSYDKMASVLAEDLNALNEIIADWMLYKWAPTKAARIIRTTGANVLGHTPNAAGNRKLFLAADLKKAMVSMNKAGVPKNNRFALIDSDMYDQLTNDTTFTANRDAIRDMNLPEGAINRLYTFNLIERSSVLIANNAGTPVIKDPSFTPAADSNAVVLCWQQDKVERALGTVEMFEDTDSPTYYGDIYSMLCRMGGRRRREDEAGVIAIVQGQ